MIASSVEGLKQKLRQATPTSAEHSAHKRLLVARTHTAMLIGTAAFGLNAFEAWMDFHDPGAVKIQLGVTAVMAAITAFSCTRWGVRHKLSLLEIGFVVACAGFEAIVIRESAIGTTYSDCFPTFFAFYCVFIPSSVVRSALVGLAALAVLIVPALVVTGDFGVIPRTLTAEATCLLVMLCGRHIANSLWEAEFRARERESAALQSQTEFVWLASHEFSNPLTPLCLLSEELAEGRVTDPHERAKRYQALVEESHRLRRRVLGLLDFGRSESGYQYQLETIDPAEVIMLVADEFRQIFGSQGYQIEIDISPDTPLITGNMAALQTVLWNLLDNAVKYSGGSQRIHLSARLLSGTVALSVQDSGIGIPSDEQQNIFKKFVRGNSADEFSHGLGVGLAVVHYIVSAHNGSVLISSVPGKGTTFTVQLPKMG